MCFGINCGCIAVAVVGACLICVDLAKWDAQNKSEQLKASQDYSQLKQCCLFLRIFLVVFTNSMLTV